MENKREKAIGVGLLFLEVSLLFALFSFIPSGVIAAIGNPNANVTTWLDVGNTYPEVIAVIIDDNAASVTLIPNQTQRVSCVGVIMEYNGDNDVKSANATFFDAYNSTSSSVDDNNDHYTNSSCELIADGGIYFGYNTTDPYYSLANCSFDIEYYANATDWECEITVVDNLDWTGVNSSIIPISELLALGLPDMINYTTINATFVSNEKVANVTNLGNTQINLSLEGYGITPGDNLAMGCSSGNIGTIPAMYEKYNLTTSIPGSLSLSEFELNYTNITSSPVVKQFGLPQRTIDAVNGETIKETYWRIYVPKGVAGTCNGTIVFGATTAIGS